MPTTLELPPLPAVVPVAKPVTPVPTTKPATRRPVLLIVDDEDGPRESLRFVFKDRVDCVTMNCGRDGIAYAKTHPVDVAILDIRMQDMTGVDVLRALKAHDPNIECILLTGHETLETARAAVSLGASDYLNTPFDVFHIREIVDGCLVRRQQKHQAAEKLQTLQKLNQDLTHAVVDQSRSTTASALSAGVVHELNNPLSIIAGYIQLLDRDLIKLSQGDASATHNIQHRFSTIQREIQRCKEIAERFLRFSRSPRLQTEIINVVPLLEDTALLLRAHPAHGQCRVIAHAIEPSLTVQASPVELMQALINIGINALQAMNGQGTLLFTVERSTAPVNPIFRAPTYDPLRMYVRFAATDTGCGIASENIEKIFAPHFTTKSSGTGMGLAIVAEIVGKAGGAIEVLSSVGKGTNFNIFLPFAA